MPSLVHVVLSHLPASSPLLHAYSMVNSRDPMDVRRLDSANKRRFAQMFDDPQHAVRILTNAVMEDRAPARVSSILLDNATIDYAVRYFNCGDREPRDFSVLPTHPRLLLVAVAEFVNAAVLYEHVLTGPENSKSEKWNKTPRGGWSEDQLWRSAMDLILPVADRLSWAEIFSVLAMAKTRALDSINRSTDGSGPIDAVGDLLGASLDHDTVVDRLNAITPTSSMHSPHYLYSVVKKDDHYYSDFSVGTLGPTQISLNAVDPANAGRSLRDEYLLLKRPDEASRIPPEHTQEHFAAHLIYRTHAYLLMADLLGCPYSADALRCVLVRRLIQSSNGIRRGFAERVVDLVSETERARDEQVNHILGHDAFNVRIPLVLKHVLSRARQPGEVLEIAIEVRDSKPARRFRRYCARVDDAIAAGRRNDVEQACAELAAYGIKLEAELSEPSSRQQNMTAATDAAKQLVSVSSPLLGALIPGLTLTTGQFNRWHKNRKFTFVEQLINTPRNLSQIEQEFATLWPHLLP